MAKRVQIIGHDSTGASAFTGKLREITVDTSKNVLIVHNGATTGGFEQARYDLSNSPAATVSAAGKMSATHVATLNAKAPLANPSFTGLISFEAKYMNGGYKIADTSQTSLGASALINSVTYTTLENTAIGYHALTTSTSSARNTAIGYNTLAVTTIGDNDNTAIGASALAANVASNNTAVGSYSCTANISGSNNAALGYQTLTAATTANNSTAIGYLALTAVAGGHGNTAVGASSGKALVNGAYNVAIGYIALFSNVTGQNNVAVGGSTLALGTSGDGNTAVGESALYTTTGTDNTAVGRDAGYSLTSGANNTLLGYNAAPSVVGVSNEITLGNSSVTTLRCQVALTVLSDERDKTNIKPIKSGLNFINQLSPVNFIWDTRNGGRKGDKDTGFLAQDLKKAQERTGVEIPNLVFENNPEKLEVCYEKLLPSMVKAIQDLSSKITALETLL